MKSRITIEVDFENGNEPIIQIVSRHSDDVRDNLIKAFYQKLGGSSWCRIVFGSHMTDPDQPDRDIKRIKISPIPSSDLRKESAIMLEQARVEEEYIKREQG